MFAGISFSWDDDLENINVSTNLFDAIPEYFLGDEIGEIVQEKTVIEFSRFWVIHIIISWSSGIIWELHF